VRQGVEPEPVSVSCGIVLRLMGDTGRGCKLSCEGEEEGCMETGEEETETGGGGTNCCAPTAPVPKRVGDREEEGVAVCAAAVCVCGVIARGGTGAGKCPCDCECGSK
jgi:hypothetical protein